jgi:hypothetical protein
MKRFTFALAATTFALAALPAAAASSIQPAQPSAFDLVNLRMTVDSCTFVPSTVNVLADGGVLKVTQHLNNCLQPGTPQVVDVRLGVLPAGEYRVELYATQRTDVAPIETIRFSVLPRAEAAVFPPIPRPLTDYTGVWYNAEQSGWGLTLTQSPSHSLFGALFVYGGNNQPLWFTLQGGQWTSSTTWRGTLYRTTGPAFSDPNFDPRLVLIQVAGEATIDFGPVPTTGRATFTYNVNNIPVTTQISRMAF